MYLGSGHTYTGHWDWFYVSPAPDYRILTDGFSSPDPITDRMEDAFTYVNNMSFSTRDKDTVRCMLH